MKKLSKLLVIFVALSCTLSLFACGGGDDTDDTKITAGEWAETLALEETNYTLKRYETIEGGTSFHYATEIKDGNKIKIDQQRAGQEDYYLEKIGESIAYLYTKSNGEWKKTEVAYNNFKSTYSDKFSYSDFTYDEGTGTYKSNGSDTMRNVELGFENGKVVKIKYDYYPNTKLYGTILLEIDYNTTSVTLPTILVREVSASEWANAMKLDEDFYYDQKQSTSRETLNTVLKGWVDGNKIKQESVETLYYEVDGETTYVYFKNQDDEWEKQEETELLLSDVRLNFSDFPYDKFTYNASTSTYKSAKFTSGVLLYKNVEVKFENGKLESVLADVFVVDGTTEIPICSVLYEITYGDITVTLPEIGSTQTPPDPIVPSDDETEVEGEDEWIEALTLDIYDNVAISQVAKDKDGNPQDVTQYWIDEGIFKTQTGSNVHYYEKVEGSNGYEYSKNGTAWTKRVTSYPVERYLPPFIEFGFDYDLMTYDESTKAYTASSIDLGNGAKYVDVEIKIKDGKLQSIKAKMYQNETLQQDTVMTFTYGGVDLVLPEATLENGGSGGSSSINPGVGGGDEGPAPDPKYTVDKENFAEAFELGNNYKFRLDGMMDETFTSLTITKAGDKVLMEDADVREYWVKEGDKYYYIARNENREWKQISVNKDAYNNSTAVISNLVSGILGYGYDSFSWHDGERGYVGEFNRGDSEVRIILCFKDGKIEKIRYRESGQSVVDDFEISITYNSASVNLPSVGK